MKVSQYIESEMVLFISASNRDDVLEQMIAHAVSKRRVGDAERFKQAIHRREQVVSTAVGMGVAIPHARIEACPDFFIVIGILEEGVDWNALDNHPVRLVFLIGGPDDRPTDYLQLLSHLTILMKDHQRRKALKEQKTPDQVVDLFRGL